MSEIFKYFVWEPSLLGPMPRIWYGKQTDGTGKDVPTVGEPVKLTDDDERSIEELAKAYPCPKQHVIAYYLDGHVQVAYCKKCSAEGEKLLEDCPQKIEMPLDDKEQTAK